MSLLGHEKCPTNLRFTYQTSPQPRSDNYKDLQPFGDVQNFATMSNWWLQLQQVTPRGCIWDTRSSEANLGLACQTDPWSEWVDCHFKWTKPYRKIHGLTFSVESQLSKLTTHSRELQLSQLSSKVDKVLSRGSLKFMARPQLSE